jgi:hypothetical protein
MRLQLDGGGLCVWDEPHFDSRELWTPFEIPIEPRQDDSVATRPGNEAEWSGSDRERR